MKAFFLLSLLLITPGHADDAKEWLAESTQLMEEAFDHLGRVNNGTSARCLEAWGSVEPLNEKEKKCAEKYEKFYEDPDGDGKVSIDLYLGYADMLDHKLAVDPINKLVLMAAALKKPCPPKVSICGFSPTDDGEVFEKTVTAPGGKKKIIQLRLRDAAVGLDNHENMAAKKEEQKKKSDKVRSQFQASLRESEAVLYLGHSRYGGGPDFYPPKLLKNGQSNAAAYKARRQGLGDIVENMNKQPKNLKFLGLFSCSSRQHFRDSIKLRKPNLDLVTLNRPVGDSVMIPGILGTLNSLIGMHCDENFSNSVNRAEKIVTRD